MPRGVRSIALEHHLFEFFLRHFSGAMGARCRSTAAAPRRWRKRAAACNDRQNRRQQRSWRYSAPCTQRTIHLGRVLARKRAAAMRGRAAIGVDDDLAAREAGVVIGTADIEFAGRVDMPDGLAVYRVLRQRLAHIGLDDSRGPVPRSCPQPDADARRRSAHADRLAVLILHGDLALGVRTQHLLLAGVTCLRDQPQDLVGIEIGAGIRSGVSLVA